MQALQDAVAPWMAVAFHALGADVTWLELCGVLLSVWMVACNMRVHALAWPLAMLSSALYAALFLHYKLYGEAGLQLLFISLAAWGWWQWLRGRGGDGTPLRVRRLSTGGRLMAAGLTLASWPLLGQLLDRVTDSDVPYFDALPTVASVTGQILLGRKLIDNWPVWVLVNLVSVALFFHKGLWLTVLLYALFTALAVAGWQAWRRLEGRIHA